MSSISSDSDSDAEYVPPRGFKSLEQARFESSKLSGKQIWLVKIPKSIIAKKQLPKRIPVPTRVQPEVEFKYENIEYAVTENKEEENMARNVKLLMPVTKNGSLKQLMTPISKVVQISEVASIPAVQSSSK
ncbi:uncharacterized protein V2V93DRAFT_380317 [Kockiozyma suomiensis]|uniref:uncharacterized protein n=1 Tax=Kockiozyma suomiensis TaxID=1337062 RepID=UPI0033432BD0